MSDCVCNGNKWSDIYFTQLFTTLGQLTGLIVSGSIAIPLVSYYSKGLKYFIWRKEKKQQ
jgi:hypothetical protein